MNNSLTLVKKNDQFRELFFPFSIGFDDFFDRLSSSVSDNPSTFPPYNILRDDVKTYIEIALAGYNKKDIDIVIEDGVLSISGQKDQKSSDALTYRGIANRKFIRKFSLGEHVEVNSAEIKDGMLTVELEEVLPPEKQPKRIEIK